MTEDLEMTILAFLKRAPEWVRRDLTAKDQSARTQAEEAFAAMLADALRRSDLNSRGAGLTSVEQSRTHARIHPKWSKA
ncbi:hypothetical protein FPZ54_02880 [Sphingomonas suaedae]|uniref:Uncharacterized protein n=1 Tax=Sphingomonas suaedae TaxID=2599297 RepID=A0A518RC72_9SPHN|nr:DUF6771 family protein [Sphingomonas suaedae]QDX25070.1 hypothetical protein FPZ54_02880 [Sphingomonas suaedae]